MPRIRLIMLAGLAVFAFSAVASASMASSASAAPGFWVCQEGGTEEFTEHLCTTKASGGKWSKLELVGAQSFNVTSTGGPAVLEQVGGGLKITCTTVVDTGTIKAGGASTAKVTFTNCTVEKPTGKCVVKEPIEVNVVDQLKEVGGRLVEEFTPAAGKIFVTLELSNKGAEKCPFGKVAVEGHATALVDNENFATEHELTFTTTSGTALEAGGVESTFTLKEKIKLENGWAWAPKK